MTFYDWLIRLKNRDTPTGDLAKDAFGDGAFPKDGSKEIILSHLRNQHACKEAIATFNSAWKSYQSYLKHHQE